MPEFESPKNSPEFLPNKLPNVPAEAKANLIYQCGVASATSQLQKLKTRNRWSTGALAITSFCLGLAISVIPFNRQTNVATGPQSPVPRPTPEMEQATTDEQTLWFKLQPNNHNAGNALTINDRNFDRVLTVEKNNLPTPQPNLRPTTVGSFLHEYL